MISMCFLGHPPPNSTASHAGAARSPGSLVQGAGAAVNRCEMSGFLDIKIHR